MDIIRSTTMRLSERERACICEFVESTKACTSRAFTFLFERVSARTCVHAGAGAVVGVYDVYP